MKTLIALFLLSSSAGAIDITRPPQSSNLPRVLYQVATATSSPATAAEMEIYNYTLPANTLVAAGDTLYVICASSTTTGTWAKNNSVYFAATEVSDGTDPSSSSVSWQTETRIMYKTGTTFNAFSTRYRDASAQLSIVRQNITFDPTVNNVISCRVLTNGTAGDVTGVMMRVVLEPAP